MAPNHPGQARCVSTQPFPVCRCPKGIAYSGRGPS
ncbi:MAG: hypothetical protein HYU99_10755 [Deltaproteobacteria bacterium]|nr:hypothetical protein [Deltaproteobacteria bacterium]